MRWVKGPPTEDCRSALPRFMQSAFTITFEPGVARRATLALTSQPMTRVARRGFSIFLLLLGTVAIGLAAAFYRLVPNDGELAARIAAAAGEKLGVKVTVGSAHLQLWPSVELTVHDFATVQSQPISLKHLVARPRIAPLLRRQLSFAEVDVDGGVVPQLSLRDLHPDQGEIPSAVAVPVEHLRFRDITWVTRYDKTLPFEGQASFAPQWRPRKAELVRADAQPPVEFELVEDGTDQWSLSAKVSGGTANGQVALRQDEGGRLQLTGHVAPDQIDVAGALDAFKVHSPVRGKVSGQTQLSATGTHPAELALSLRTHTAFSVAPATLLHVDVDKAIHSLGADHAGQTSLRSLTGHVDTANTPDGMVVRFTGLQAQGDSFTAKGGGTIARRQVEGQMTVDVAHGLVGVPLRISGPAADPHVSVQAGAATGAAAGAAIGTAVLPGVGTAVGAGLGGIIGKLFKPHEPQPGGGPGP